MKIKRRKPKKVTVKRRKVTTKQKSTPTVEFISSGSTPLNLSLSGKGPKGGWARARIGNIVGGRSAGKTAVALECAFWYYKNINKIKSVIFPPVDEFTIVYNNAEASMDFDIPKMYGPKFNDKVHWVRSPNVEHFGRDYFRHVDNLEPGHSLLYILDTLDFLRSKDSLERFAESVKKDDSEKGSYDLSKQKYLSSFFAVTSKFLDENKKDATLMILSQIRDKIGVVFGKKQMRTGGRAFDHAVHQELWIKEKQKLRATKKGEERVYGIDVACRVEKNKCAKPFRECNFQILYDYGIDNLSSMINYLWGKKQINFDGQTFKTKKPFIKYIEDNNYERLIEEKTEQKWHEIEHAFEAEVESRNRRW